MSPILWTIPTYSRYVKSNGGVWAMSLFRALSPSLQKLKKPANRTVAGCRNRGALFALFFWVWLLVLGDGLGVGGDAEEGSWGRGVGMFAVWLGRRYGSQ